MMNKIIMLIGAAASGKSTAAPKIAAKNNAVIISTDRIRAALYGAEHIQGYWPDIEAVLYDRIKNAIKQNKNIISGLRKVNYLVRSYIMSYYGRSVAKI